MRLRCTVLLGIAVAIVSTNALDDDDGDGEERMKFTNIFKSRSSGYERVPEMTSSNLATESLNSMKNSIEEKGGLKAVLNNNVILEEWQFELSGLLKANKELERLTPFLLLRTLYKDSEIIEAIDDGFLKHEQNVQALLIAYTFDKKSLSVSEVEGLRPSTTGQWGKIYRAAINEAIEKAKNKEDKDRLRTLLS